MSCFIFWGLFIYTINTKEKRRTIRYYHDTISSFCASSDTWENRFLLTFTILISMNILCLYTEEYNSREQESKYLWLFLLECSAASAFPLVGICYTEGKYIVREALEKKMSLNAYEKIKKQNEEDETLLSDGTSYIRLKYCDQSDVDDVNKCDLYIQKENIDLNCGRCTIPIFYSMLIHSFAALYFLFVLSFCNVYYVVQLWLYHKHGTGFYICLVLGIFNVIVLPMFIIVQGMIKLRCVCLCKMKTMRMISFLFECLSGLFVIALTVVGSMKRNNDIHWFD
eukprot:457797_1